MTRADLLRLLPPDQDKWILINKSQTVPDIIREICEAHGSFKSLYDRIGYCFDARTIPEICDNLDQFCRANIAYREETDKRQQVAVPQGILNRGYGDCKSYASFCGGVLGGLKRATGKKISWHYRFASYNMFRRTPYHVFVVVQYNGNEIWIDPTPGADNKNPVWVINKKVN